MPILSRMDKMFVAQVKFWLMCSRKSWTAYIAHLDFNFNGWHFFSIQPFISFRGIIMMLFFIHKPRGDWLPWSSCLDNNNNTMCVSQHWYCLHFSSSPGSQTLYFFYFLAFSLCGRYFLLRNIIRWARMRMARFLSCVCETYDIYIRATPFVKCEHRVVSFFILRLCVLNVSAVRRLVQKLERE